MLCVNGRHHDYQMVCENVYRQIYSTNVLTYIFLLFLTNLRNTHTYIITYKYLNLHMDFNSTLQYPLTRLLFCLEKKVHTCTYNNFL